MEEGEGGERREGMVCEGEGITTVLQLRIDVDERPGSGHVMSLATTTCSHGGCGGGGGVVDGGDQPELPVRSKSGSGSRRHNVHCVPWDPRLLKADLLELSLEGNEAQ